MANKLDSVLANILTALQGVEGLREVRRGLVLPEGQSVIPAAGIVADRVYREGSVWHCEAAVMLLCRSARDAADANVLDLLAAVDAAITALRDGGKAGGYIDAPTFDVWAAPLGRGEPIQTVGFWGSLHIRVEGPL